MVPNVQFIKGGDWAHYYNVETDGLRLGKERVDYNVRTTFDVGSTLTYFDFGLFSIIERSFAQFCKSKKQNCGGYEKLEECFPRLKSQQIVTFPEITFYFGQVEYV